MGVAKGHNLIIDQVTLQQVMDKSKVYDNGLKVKLNHGSGVEAICGRIKNIRVLGDKCVGDFHLLKSHPRYDLILEMAELQPDTFGMSVAFQGNPEPVPTGLAARVDEIFSCDLVCEPAATEALFEESRIIVDTEMSVMGTNIVEAKGTENAEKPEKDTKVGEESVMGRMASLEARLKSFEDALLSAKKDEEDEEEEEETEMSHGKDKEKEKEKEFSSQEAIQSLVRNEIVKQLSAMGTPIAPTPSVAVEAKEAPKAPTFFELVDAEVKGGKSRGNAVEFVVAKHPEAHMSYLESIGAYKK